MDGVPNFDRCYCFPLVMKLIGIFNCNAPAVDIKCFSLAKSSSLEAQSSNPFIYWFDVANKLVMFLLKTFFLTMDY